MPGADIPPSAPPSPPPGDDDALLGPAVEGVLGALGLAAVLVEIGPEGGVDAVVGTGSLSGEPAVLDELGRQAAAVAGTGQPSEVVVSVPGGPPLHLALRPVRDPAGRVRRVIATAAPPAADRQLAARLQDLQRANRELERFATVASHDLQEPLRRIVSFGDLLEARGGHLLDTRSRDYLARMQASASRLSALIHDLLDLSRAGGPLPEAAPVDLDTLVRDLAEELLLSRPEARIEVGLLPVVLGHQAQLARVLQNLLDNALKFARPGHPPEVEVTARRLPDGHPVAPGWELAVADRGRGLQPHETERIFEPFTRLAGAADQPGTGIGLAICRRIVQRYGGRVAAAPREGGGAVLTVALPDRPLTEG